MIALGSVRNREKSRAREQEREKREREREEKVEGGRVDGVHVRFQRYTIRV